MPLPDKCPFQHEVVEAISHLGEDAYPSKIPDGLSALGFYRASVAQTCRALDSMKTKGWVTSRKVGRREIYTVARYPGRGR